MRALLVFAFLTLSQAVELEKPEQQLPEPIELPAHVATLITNHVNHVLEQKPHGQPTALTGHVPQVAVAKGNGNGNSHENGRAAVAVPHLDLLPPHVEQSKVPQVINHQATATWQHTAPADGHNKVVMPPVSQIVVSLPGQAPLEIGDKVKKIHQHISHVMQQAQTQIPQAINQAIKEREMHKQQQHSSTTTTTTGHPDHKTARLLASDEPVPQLIERQRELQKLGKCNFQCPQHALPVCATNGKCVVEFSGQCELSQWNCFNTMNIFRQVHDDECNNTIKCYDRDMI